MPVVTVDLSGVDQLVNPKFYPLFFDEHRVNVLIGGASSSKSYSTAQKIVYKLLFEDGHRFLVVRKVAKTLRHSVYDQIVAIIDEWNMRGLFDISRGDLGISCKFNSNEIIFAGLDDVYKLKSIWRVTDIWVEEASEITEDEFNQLDLRLRGHSKFKKQITLTMNPISVMHWVHNRFFARHEPDTITHHSTYRDNRFLDLDTVARLEAITDPYYRAVYVNGEWGVFGNVVFTDYVIEDFDLGEDDLENVRQGMDFGYAHASAIERCGFRDNDLYVFDELWGRGWTNRRFIEAAEEYFADQLDGCTIRADSSEPDRIEEWNAVAGDSMGVMVEGAKKGKGSVRYGVDFLVAHRIHVHEKRCPALAREITAFKRREDRDGNALDDFVEINDDTIAALRYAVEDLWIERQASIPDDWGAGDLGL